MLGDITIAKDIYIACGYTDMRKSIDGLAAVVQEQFNLNPFTPSLYLFCGKRREKEMDSAFYTSVWRMEASAGRAQRKT